MTDPELVEASRRGDREAYGALVERHMRMVEAVAFGAAGERSFVDDIVQDTFVAAWHRLDRLRDGLLLRPWLCGIARNVARKARRRQGRTSAPCEVEGGDSPFELAADHQREREVRSALAKLSPRYREPLVLFYFEQCTVRELAATLSIREDAAMQRLSRGRQQLGEALATRLEESPPRRLPGKAIAAAVLALLPLARPRSAFAAAGIVAHQVARTGARHWRLGAATVAAFAVALVVLRAVEKSERVAAAARALPSPAAARDADRDADQGRDDAHSARPAPSAPPAPQLPASPDRPVVYQSIVVASTDPVETCRRGVRDLVARALARSTVVVTFDDDGTVRFESDPELERIASQVASHIVDTCASWPEVYVTCDATLPDLLAGAATCYPYDPFE